MAERKIVLPGEKIADKPVTVSNTFTDGTDTFACVIGLMDEEGRYIPLETRYRPMPDDTIIAVVSDVRHAGYSVQMNLPFPGFISSKDFMLQLEIGDIVACKVGQAYETGDVDFAEVKKLQPGKVISFPPAKVPRLIGRKSSMISLIREHAGGDIAVGNNGFVWISEKCNIPLVLKAINLIINKAHISGLTDAMAQFLANEKR